MKSINEYRAELAEVEEELRKISVEKSTKGVYDYERGDVAVVGETYTDYVDLELADKLIKQRDELREKISNYAIYAQAEREAIEMEKKRNEEAEKRNIEAEARELYEKAQMDYHNKGLLGRAKYLFSGKKPKMNLSEQEIQETYGKEAKIQHETNSIELQIAELEKQRQEQIDWYERHPENKQVLDGLLLGIDNQIAELKDQLNSKGVSR